MASRATIFAVASPNSAAVAAAADADAEAAWCSHDSRRGSADAPDPAARFAHERWGTKHKRLSGAASSYDDWFGACRIGSSDKCAAGSPESAGCLRGLSTVCPGTL